MTADFPPCVTPELLAAVHANDRRNPMSDTTDPLDVLQAALDAATPGPWGVDSEVPLWVNAYSGRLVTEAHERADAAAIVALRNAAPDLLAAVRNVRALADEFSGYPQPGCPEAATRLRAALGSFGGQQ